MKPVFALLLFLATTTLFYFQPTPDPSKHLPTVDTPVESSRIARFDMEVDYVTDPSEVNIP